MSDPLRQTAGGAPRAPVLRAATAADLLRALRRGWADFRAAPTYGVVFGGGFALCGMLVYVLMVPLGMPWLMLPILIGLPLVGPFVAAGLYEISRRLGAGLPLGWGPIFSRIFAQRERQFGWMAFVILFVFWIWVYQVRLLVALFMGLNTPATLPGFLAAILGTPSGLAFLAVGSAVGLVLALVLFSLTVFALPVLFDTEVDFVTAMIVSVKAVLASPLVMLGLGVCVTGLALLATLPAFLGHVVVLPLLGHAAWHLYAVLREPWPD